MAVEGEIVIAKITDVVEKSANGRTAIGGYYAGYVVGTSPWGFHHLIDGSVQGIPAEHRVVGRLIKLRWGKAGGYCGPLFAGIPEEGE